MACVRWSDQQRSMLRAMGFTPMQLRTRADPGVPGVDRAHPLFAYLCRAAGEGLQRATDEELAHWAQRVRLPDLQLLGADPAAKRGLWRRIRQLRRSGRG